MIASVNPYIVLGSAVVGFLVGLTGAGGGALMTPMLILLFNVKPLTAISSDLVAAVFMRPFGAAVHMTKGTVNFKLVGWMVAGSVPMAFLGAYLLHLMGHAKTSQTNIEKALGAALLVGAAAMVVRYILDRRSGQKTPRCGPRPHGPATSHRTYRHGWWPHRRDDLSRLGVIDDRVAALSVSNDRGKPIGRHGPHPGSSPHRRRRPRSAGLRARRVCRHHIAHHWECSWRSGWFVPLIAGPGQVHPSSDHVCDIRFRAQVRRPRNNCAWVGALCHPARCRGHLARLRSALAKRSRPEQRPSPTPAAVEPARIE